MVLQLTLTTILLFSMIGCKKETPKHDFTLHYHAHCKSSPFKVRYVSGLNEKKVEFVISEETVSGNTFDKTITFNTSPDNGWQPYIEATNTVKQNNDSLSVSITLNGQTTTEFLRFNNELRTIRNTVILAD